MLIESMKMHHAIEAPCDGTVAGLLVEAGATVMAGAAVATIDARRRGATGRRRRRRDRSRPAFERISPRSIARHAIGLDAARPEAVERRRAVGRRTARENVADLVDDGSFVEYGPVVIAAQRRRRPRRRSDRTHARRRDDRWDRHGQRRPVRRPRRPVVAMSYDYTVLAGTQGQQNHRKKDRLFEVAERLRLPVVFFTEGGGGRPGDTDGVGVSGLDCWAFNYFGRLSGARAAGRHQRRLLLRRQRGRCSGAATS